MTPIAHIHLPGAFDAWDDPELALAEPPLPGLSASVSAPAADGVVTFAGTADAGSIVEIAQEMAGGRLQVIGQATADAGGAFTFGFPAAALGYGSVTLAVREMDAGWNPGAWSAGTGFSFDDPETGLRHVGGDLAAALQHDAATGADATADIQAVADEAASGGPAVLDIPAGNYFIGNTILLPSGSIMDDPGVKLVASPAWQRPVSGSLLGYTMVANADYASGTIADSGIQIRNVAFDWNGFLNYGSAAVRFINAENVLVQDSSFAGNEDGTAFLHCDGAVVNGATAVGTVNYAFDNWDGPVNTVIENSTAEVARGSGIAITGRGTAASDAETARNDTLIGNAIYGNNGPGIDVSSLSVASAVNDMFIGGNLVVGPGAGISLTGTGSGAVITGNTISGSLGPALQVSNLVLANAALEQQDVVVAGNTIGNAIVPNGATAAVIVQAQGAGVFGNTVQYGGQRFDLWLAGNDETSGGNVWDDWQVAAVTTTWATNFLLSDPPGSSSSPTGGQAPYSLNNGTLTITGAGTLDLRGATGITVVQATEGLGETVYLPAAAVHLTVTSAAGNGAPGTIGFGAPGIAGGLTVYGAAAPDTIDLGAGDDTVVVGGGREVVRGGGGADTFYVAAANANAAIDGGGGASQVVVSGGGGVMLGANITDIAKVKIEQSTGPTTLTLNGLPGLTAYASGAGDTLIAGGTGQRLVGGALIDTLVGVAAGGVTFAGRAADLEGDTIKNFALGDTIDVTSVGTLGAGFDWNTIEVPGMTTVNVFDGHDGTAVNIQGTIDGTRFHLVPDGGLGVELVYAPGTYTVYFGGFIADVLQRIAVGGPDAAVDTAFTMLFGGPLPPGGTVALKADMVPVDLSAGSSLTIDGTGHTLNAGAYSGLAVTAGDVTVVDLTISGAGGGMALAGGALRLDSAGSFGGGVAIGGGTLVLGIAGAAGDGRISFTGAASLEIAPGVSVANTIDGFGTSDTFAVDGVGGGSAAFDKITHQLTITGSGGPEVLHLAGDYYVNGFKTAPAGAAGGTLVTYVACFAAGTRIGTPAGEVAVEELRIGDLVATVSGAAKPVKWIGWRGYAAATMAENPNLRPVVIRAGALGSGLPWRDLVVSPLHALLIEGVLVPAAALVNGRSIVRRATAGAVQYFHVELDRHDVIFAEGAAAETFVDEDSRETFENARDYYDLYGFTEPSPGFAAARLEDGYRLERIRRRLGAAPPEGVPGALAGHVERLENGMLEGWVMDRANPLMPVELEVLDGDAVVVRAVANRYRVDLDRAGLAGGRCGFSVAMPVVMGPVAVRRLGDGRRVANAAGVKEGWGAAPNPAKGREAL